MNFFRLTVVSFFEKYQNMTKLNLEIQPMIEHLALRLFSKKICSYLPRFYISLPFNINISLNYLQKNKKACCRTLQ